MSIAAGGFARMSATWDSCEPMHYVFLIGAIIAEVVATTSLKASEGFTKFWPSVVVVVGYAIAFYLLSLVLKSIPTGVAYAIWSGVGVVLIALAAWLLQGQKLDAAAMIGMALIVAGVVVMNLFSKTAAH
jgi:small multidrug resistance pump